MSADAAQKRPVPGARAASSPLGRAPAPRTAWGRFRRHRAAVAGLGLLGAVVLLCALGPPVAGLVAGLDATTQNVALGASPPSWRHPFGTDVLGRDLLVRTLHGGRVALAVGLLASVVAFVIGVAWGAVAGWVGGRLDGLMMRIVDALYALPAMILAIVVMAVLDDRGVPLLVGLLGGISWLTMARVVRAEVRALRRSGFVEAARASGAPAGRIVVAHVVPNVAGVIAVCATTTIPEVMVQEAFLSFLGLGVQPPGASWGTLVVEGARLLVVYPWVLAGPGLFLAVTLLALGFVGDGVRDAVDPRP